MPLTRKRQKLNGLPLAAISFHLVFLCSCATQSSSSWQLPATVTMNPEAGRGGFWIVTCHLADGRKLPMVVDTGCPVTAFDKSLEPEFGGRIDTGEFWNFGVRQKVGIYSAPELYLGKVRLHLSDANVITYDRQQLADHGGLPFMGILGMNVLQNYCLQCDFTAGKASFLDGARADKKDWGQAFPLTDMGDGCFFIKENLAGVSGSGSVIDTGCDSSGWLRPEIYQQWTNQAAALGITNRQPDGVLGGEVYHDLDLRSLNPILLATNDTHTTLNGVGLHVLSENLLTLDFPGRTMYLKRTSKWPLIDRGRTALATTLAKSALKSLIQWKKEGQLPGAVKSDNISHTVDFHFDRQESPYFDRVTCDLFKNGDTAVYHYTLSRTAKNGPWKLQRAWRSDKDGKLLEEFPVP